VAKVEPSNHCENDNEWSKPKGQQRSTTEKKNDRNARENGENGHTSSLLWQRFHLSIWRHRFIYLNQTHLHIKGPICPYALHYHHLTKITHVRRF